MTKPRRRTVASFVALLLIVAAAGAVVLRQGGLPVGWSPLPALDLAAPDAWFLDLRLAELRRDPALCRRVLRPPTIEAVPIPAEPLKDGCGWPNAVRLASIGGARLPLDKVSCELAAALALWLAHEVQPRAEHIFGSRVASVQHMGSYSCRNIVGNKLLSGVRSEHATSNALDIAGFTLIGGHRISVLRHWGNGDAKEARFLREIHARACRYFRVAIGPAFNAAHRDHFHLDRGFLSRCR